MNLADIKILLEVLGGSLYLANKILFCVKERSRNQRKWHILSWTAYLLGLPLILVLFSLERDWIVVGVEAGGAPAMAMGLVIALRGKGKEPRWLDRAAILAVFLGIAGSAYDFGGITKTTQLLELSLSIGFLLGTYRLAKENSDGYLWFLLMNSSCAALAWAQDLHFIFVQQLASLVFVFDAYIRTRSCRKETSSNDSLHRRDEQQNERRLSTAGRVWGVLLLLLALIVLCFLAYVLCPNKEIDRSTTTDKFQGSNPPIGEEL